MAGSAGTEIGARVSFTKLLAGFVETDYGAVGVVRSMVNLQHVLHGTDEIGVLLGRNHPLAIQPGLQLVFFSVLPDGLGTDRIHNSNSTSLSANSRKVQRAGPSAGAAGNGDEPGFLCAVELLVGRFEDIGRRDNAASNPSSTNRWRSRWIVEEPTSKASAISVSDQASPSRLAFKRIRARKVWSAAILLPDSRPSTLDVHPQSNGQRIWLPCPWLAPSIGYETERLSEIQSNLSILNGQTTRDKQRSMLLFTAAQRNPTGKRSKRTG